jgi:mRNA interferase YafQ
MLQPIFTKHFEKDIELCKRRNYDMDAFKSIAILLLEEKPLPKKHRDHKLSGNFNKHRECHIKPDWLLIYYYNREHEQIIFERTGSHSDLFG